MAKELDRRTLLKGFTFSALGFGSLVAFGDVLESFALPNGQKIALAKAAIFADKTLCSGCRTCEMVCANFNSGGRNSSSLARISVEKEYVKGDYQPKVCYQCADPPCLKVCPVGALRRFSERNIRSYHRRRGMYRLSEMYQGMPAIFPSFPAEVRCPKAEDDQMSPLLRGTSVREVLPSRGSEARAFRKRTARRLSCDQRGLK